MTFEEYGKIREIYESYKAKYETELEKIENHSTHLSLTQEMEGWVLIKKVEALRKVVNGEELDTVDMIALGTIEEIQPYLNAIRSRHHLDFCKLASVIKDNRSYIDSITVFGISPIPQTDQLYNYFGPPGGIS